jgi:tetrahydromethanopterin S-methyltransferase subunit B
MEHIRGKHMDTAGSDTSAFFQAIVGLAVAALVMLGVCCAIEIFTKGSL